MNRWNIIGRIGITMALAVAAYTGCQSGAPIGVNPPAGDVATVGAVLPDVPMEFAPNQSAERTNYLDVSSQLPEQDATDVAFGFDPAHLAISVQPDAAAKAVVAKTLTITLAIAEGANSTPCTSGVGAGKFIVDVAADGSVTAITPERPRLGEIVATAIRLGEVSLCTKVDANFTGSIVIKQTKIDVAFNGVDLRGTDDNLNGNTSGNTNDNANGNSNDNGDDNANGNTDDNVNGNTDDDANGNKDDDSNDNADDDSANDNSDDNADDDNANDNTDDDSNDNADDDNINDNSDDNANDNTDDDSNDNADDDNANDNTDDNANDNTDDDNVNDNSDDNTNTNDNGNANDNSNDNTSGGVCADGSTRLEGEMDSPVELEAEYRLFPAGCARFRVEVRDYVGGSYDILVNGAVVGTISVGGDGRGEVRLDTEDGNFPSDFPLMAVGDVVQVGSFSVTVGDDCSLDDVETCNGNGNTNGNSNNNANTNG